MNRLGRRRHAVVVMLGLAIAGCGGDGSGEPASTTADRIAEVRERGADVMPFDLDATTHVFRKTADGGVQEVVVDDPSDTENLRLVRAHLAEEAERFRSGDFSDPMQIHGSDMPGVAALAAGHDQVDVALRDIDGGARIRYTSNDPTLVAALHDWFDAQLHDHGPDAHAGH